MINMLLQRYFHDHTLTPNDVCTNLLHKCWQLKFWKIKFRKFIWSEVKCWKWIFAQKKNPRTKMLPLEECHCRHVLTLLVCRAGPEGGFTLLSTRKQWDWYLMVGTVYLWFTLLCVTVLKLTHWRYLSLYLTRVQHMYKVGCNGVSSFPVVDPASSLGFEGYVLNFIPPRFLSVSMDYSEVKKENLPQL